MAEVNSSPNSGGHSSDRPHPISLEAEQALLGALLLNNTVYGQIATLLKPEHFAEELHARIYDCASQLIKAGKVASPITLRPYLGEHDLGGTTMPQYIARLCVEATAVINATSYAATIRELADRRAMIETAGELVEAAMNAGPSDSMASIASDGITALHALATSGHSRTNTRLNPGESAACLINRARRIMAKEIVDDGVSTGIAGLDRDTGGGFQPGTLWIVGGRPGQGKSIFATSTALKVAKRGLRDLHASNAAAGAMLFSLELPEDQLMARLLADLSFQPRHPLPFSVIMRGDLKEEDLWYLEDAQKRLAQMPLALDVASRLSVAEIALRVRAEKERMKRRGVRLGVVYLDYLKMIKASDRYRGQRVYEVGEISGGLKQLAKDENVCIVLLAQLNRLVAAHDRKDKRPTLVDLRESGDLEADADVVAFVHREAYYIKHSAEYRNGEAEAVQAFLQAEHEGEIILGKSRVGPTNTHQIWCDIACSTFSDRSLGGYAND